MTGPDIWTPTRQWNVNFERALIGNFLLCHDVGRQPSPGFEDVPPEDYFLQAHGEIAAVLLKMLEKSLPICGPVLYDELLKSFPEKRASELIAYASGISDGVPWVSPNWFYAGFIRRYAALRRLADLQKAISETTFNEGLPDLAERLRRAIAELPPEPSVAWPKLGQVIDELTEEEESSCSAESVGPGKS